MDSLPDSHPLPLRRRLRRRLVKLRTRPWLVPLLLLLFYLGIMAALSLVADGWIVAVAATPLLFALVLTLGCLAAYRRDFYA
ncbi:MAG: hypothetical protein VKM98_05440 [Cyanobacteriota bacterium]|nr:hypothetical protein [Cyanobacteriota bacterium]